MSNTIHHKERYHQQRKIRACWVIAYRLITSLSFYTWREKSKYQEVLPQRDAVCLPHVSPFSLGIRAYVFRGSNMPS